MKRIGNIYDSFCSMDNLILAEKRARKGKSKQYGVKVFDRNRESNLLRLNEMLKNKTYQTSKYNIFKVYEPKERDVYQLPFFPDRIAHHAAMIPLEPMFTSMFTADTYSCIKNKGIHGASRSIQKALKDVVGTQYCLKLDIKKFYPSIDHNILKSLLRKKIKDKDFLWFLDEVIDSAPGVPIGNYLSQYFANFYLAYFDHWIKEVMGVKYYFRYADDMVILAKDKPSLHKLLADIRAYFEGHLKLTIKDNYQIFLVSARGIDVLGYVFFHDCIYLRKGIKKRFARKMFKDRKSKSIPGYYGWAKHCNSINLLKKLLYEAV